MNKSEMEIDEIRLKLYEETKGMTTEEQIKRVNNIGHELAIQYGFKIGKPKSLNNIK